MLTQKDRDKVLEVRLAPNGKGTVEYTVGHFFDEVMADKKKIAINKFWHITDDWQTDVTQDPNVKRRGKRYSISRDSLEGPRIAGGLSGPAAFDATRFRDEADRLIRYGCVKAHIDWNDDDSINRFFASVNHALMNATPTQARDIVSAGPSIFMFTELMKKTEKIVTEELTELWARRIFPVHMLNTWLPVWNYMREAEQTSHLPQYVNYDEVPSNIGRHRERRVPVSKQLLYWDDGASWTQHELWVMAEAVANGAAPYPFDVKRTASARRNMLYKENLLAWFGDPEVKLWGVMSASADTGIEHIPAVAQFGSGSSELDRQLLINTALSIANETDETLAPNFIGLSNPAFYHVISRRYGDVSNDSNETVADAALDTLKKIGITAITRVPELGPRTAEQNKLVSKGVNAAEALRLSGGIHIDDPAPAQVDAMLVMRRDPDVAELIVAKDITMYPSAETVRGKTELRMIMGSGGMEFYKPSGVKLVTNTVGEDTFPVPSAPPD